MTHTDPQKRNIEKFQSLKIQDGGWPPFCKLLNRYNSATVPSAFTKFGKMTHFGRLYPVDRKCLKSKMADGCHVKTVKSPCIGNRSIDLLETRYGDAFLPS